MQTATEVPKYFLHFTLSRLFLVHSEVPDNNVLLQKLYILDSNTLLLMCSQGLEPTPLSATCVGRSRYSNRAVSMIL